MPHQTTYNIVWVVSANGHLGDGLSAHACESVRRIVGKYFSPMTSTSVHFGQAGNDNRCTLTKQIAGLPTKSREACSKDFYAAFDAALASVAEQLRRAKRALRDDQALRTNQDMGLLAVSPMGGNTADLGGHQC
jgi:ribosomal subunit interface protein